MTARAATLPAKRNRARPDPVPATAPPRESVIYGMQPARPTPSAAWWHTLPATLRAPAEARRHTRSFLERCAAAPDPDLTVLVVSELVANAANAMTARAEEQAAGPAAGAEDSREHPQPGPAATLNLSFRLFPDHLLIEVIDTAPGIPRPRLDPDHDATSARGLAVVHEATGHQWGWFRSPDGRKVVYARLTVPPPPGNAGPPDLPPPHAAARNPARRPARRSMPPHAPAPSPDRPPP